MEVDFCRSISSQHLIIVGGSDIGLELGRMCRRFGSPVMIVEMAPGLVRHEDENLSAAIEGIVEREGVDSHGHRPSPV